MRLPAAEPKRARIEIVPMIDTVFFLLVYFMVASLSMTHLNARRVTLPFSRTATGRPAADIVVTIARDGHDYLDRDPIAEGRLPGAINARLLARPGVPVIINCDRNLPAGRFARVLDLVKQSDAVTVMAATTPDAHGGAR